MCLFFPPSLVFCCPSVKERNMFSNYFMNVGTKILIECMQIFMQVRWWRQHNVCLQGQLVPKVAIHHAAPAFAFATLTSRLGPAPKCMPTYLNPQAARKWSEVHHMWAHKYDVEVLRVFLLSLSLCCIFRQV